MSVRRLVIAGGGIAGVSTAGELRAKGYDGELTLVDTGEFPYDRPPLSKEYLAGTADLKQIALRPPEWYIDQDIRLITRTAVTALRPREAGVELADGSLLPADRVVLATGGRAARPPFPGAGHPLVHVLRTAEDADRLRAALTPGAEILVVGGGLIGAEVASTAVGLGCEVVLADPASPPLERALGAPVASWLHGVHVERGITTLTAGVESFAYIPSWLSARFTDGSPPRGFDAVVLGVGMVCETSLAEAAGLDVDGGVLVDPGRTTSNPAVLAVGDSARVRRDGVLLPRAEHWDAAQDDGRRAAATLLGTPQPAPAAPWFWTDRHGLHVEVVGDMSAAADHVVRGEIGAPPFSVFGVAGDRVTGAVSVNDSKAVRAARRMIDRALPADPAALADPATDLRALLRR